MGINDYPSKGMPDTNRLQGQVRRMPSNPPLITPNNFPLSHDLLDQLAGRLKPGRVNFDGSSNLTVAHLILPASPKRVAIHFVGPNSGRVTVSHEPSLSLDNGLTFSSTAGILSIDAKTAGDAVTREWYAIYPAGATPLAWIEVYAPDNV